MSGRVRSRAWCFTVPNPGAVPFDWNPASMVFLIYQKELAPTTGTPHFQGYVVFKNPQSLVALRALNASAHYEVAQGNAAQNVTYCSKEPRVEATVTFGEVPSQGALMFILNAFDVAIFPDSSSPL